MTGSALTLASLVAATDDAVGEVEEEDISGFDAAWFIAWVLAVGFVVLALIGVVTVLGWLIPG